jgi:hypothetical protein
MPAKPPELPPLVWNGYFWEGQVTLATWRGFQTRRGPYAGVSAPQPSDGTVRLSFLTPDNEEVSPSAEQIEAYRYLLANEKCITDVVLAALFAAYPQWREEYEDAYSDDGDFDEIMPPLQQAGQLRALIGLGPIHILSEARDGVAYVGFELGCVWEEEHGLGVMTHQDRVLEVGQADTSFNWSAGEDADE